MGVPKVTLVRWVFEMVVNLMINDYMHINIIKFVFWIVPKFIL